MSVIASQVAVPCSDGFAMPAHFARPSGEDAVHGVVFMFEAFGMTDEMRLLAGDLAGHGFAVILPDLLGRGRWLPCIRKVFADFRAGKGQTFDDLAASRTWLSEQPGVVPDRLGIMGLCIGGSFALLLSKTGQYRVSVPFYGAAPADLAGSCPIVASYGGRDRPFRSHAARLQAELPRHGIPHDVKVYPDAGHSFMNRAPNRVIGTLMGLVGAGFQPEVAADATERLVAFLRTHL